MTLSITGNFYADMAGIADLIKGSADDYILDGNIVEQQKIIRKLTEEIGNLTLLKLEEGEEMSPEVMERYEVIKEAKQKIEEMKADKKTVFVECPECGAKASVNMKYCGSCGSALNK